MKTKPATAKTSKIAKTLKSTKATKSGKGTISVMGEGEIKLRPDLAILDLNVVTTAKSAQEAVQKNTERMSAVISALKGLGISGAELQTVGYDVSPLFDNDEKSPTFGRILEQRVSSQLRVRVDVEMAGQAIDAAISAGANMTSGLRFTLRDEMAPRSRAIKLAMRSARRDAEAATEALAAKLQDAEVIEINMGGPPFIMRAMAFEKSAPPIEPGTISLTANVRVVYRYS